MKTSEVIHTNQKHPFLTREKGFLPVGQIKLGMHVLRADGTYGVVTGWKVVPGTQVMYNLEVAQDHTYTVGAGQWVVHNSSCYDLATQADKRLNAAGNISAIATSNVKDAAGNTISGFCARHSSAHQEGAK